jgi:hypothetical protein
LGALSHCVATVPPAVKLRKHDLQL